MSSAGGAMIAASIGLALIGAVNLALILLACWVKPPDDDADRWN